MPKLQIFHERNFVTLHKNYTVMCFQPFRSELETLERKLEVNEPAILTLGLGTARMHPKERQFVKKTGREIAKQNMKFVILDLTNVHKRLGHTYYVFIAKDHTIEVEFLLSHGKNAAFLTNLDWLSNKQ